ncbi:MAG: type II toxin-antitoxin system RelE/ParE family toxin [Gemmatimonadetes bacterium]|jgi:toxin ParE1/3/4|nr:type II toxin-antitoxin system RelE/ParE family toxin [Gemmatimonadota bacterium]MBT7861588.1 type II toxin-antitoxin system RelE/ParE family toxin [Gemmatimonadota bacterium]
MAEVRWTLQALDDVEAICLFIARDAPRVASVFADRAFLATDRLVEHPRLGRVVPETQDSSVREISVYSYRIIYRIRRDEVQVLTVHHGARLLHEADIEDET